MSGIRGCDEEAMLSRNGYEVSTVWPCVTVPLTLGLLVLIYAWYKTCGEWTVTPPPIRKAVCAVLFLESVFGVACWVQVSCRVPPDRHSRHRSSAHPPRPDAHLFTHAPTISASCSFLATVLRGWSQRVVSRRGIRACISMHGRASWALSHS